MKKRHPFFWIMVAVGALIALIDIAIAITISRYGSLANEPGWKPDFQNQKVTVGEVEPGSEASRKLVKGDWILAIDGQPPVPGLSISGNQKLILPAGESYTLRISRTGKTFEFTLKNKVYKSVDHLLSVLALLVAAGISFFVSLLIGLSKPEEKVPQLAALMGLSVGFVQLISTLTQMEHFLGVRDYQLAYLIWLISFSPISVALGFDFFFRFPTNTAQSSRWRFVQTGLYIWSGAIAAYFTVLRIITLSSLSHGIDYAMTRMQHLTINMQILLNPLMLVSLPAIVAVILWNFRRMQDPQHCDRIRWIAGGSIIGLTPMIAYFLFESFRNDFAIFAISNHQLNSLFLIANLSLSLIPLAIGYGVVKHQVFGIQVVVRLGFQYILAKHVLQLLIYLPVIILGATVYMNRDRPLIEILFSNTAYVALTVAALIGLKFRTAFLEKVDRRFFREAYVSEKILMKLVEDIGNMDSMSEISRSVSDQIESALHPKKISIFYRGAGRNELVLGHSSGEHNQDLRISLQSEIVKAIENQSSGEIISVHDRQDLPESEKAQLKSLDADLIVPVVASNRRVVGLLLLGEKKSEEIYTPQDKKMLKAVAAQLGVVYENVLLKERVDRDRKVQNEVLTHLRSQNRNLLRECPTCGSCYDSTAEFCSNDSTELNLTLPVERTIDEKYRLDRLLGKGGMGAVYEALDLRLQRKVAIKILVGNMFGDHLALSRFEREARASAKMNHPNVVTIYDFGGIEGQGAYLTMELLRGSTLRAVLKQYGNLHPKITAEYFDQILKGIKAAHNSGIIHRDLKPENIYISKDDDDRPLIKVLDLGLAKIKQLDRPDSISLTKPGTILGTLNYMSPEQIAGGEVDERTDIFSAGVMIVETLMGRQPFTGRNVSEVAIEILQKPVRLEGDSDQVRRLDAALQKCLAKNRDHRYPSVHEMQQELLPLIAECPPFPGQHGTNALIETIPN
jgi:serine/threonine protein kinase